MKWFGFIIITFLHTISSPLWAGETDCGLSDVQVKYAHLCDAEMACEGITRALDFFEMRGYHLSGEIKIEFVDNMYVEKINNGKMDVIKLQACGYYCSLDGICRITSWLTVGDEQIKIFGELNITKELFISLVVHEVSHCLYHNNFKLNNHEIDRSLTEFISYAAQIETMKKGEKNNVLGLYPEAVFTSISEINSLNHAMNPHKFGVMSYRYFKKNPEILKLIYNGEIESGDKLFLEYNFLQR